MTPRPVPSPDFTVVYASGLSGVAGDDPEAMAEDLAPLFDAILRVVPAPRVAPQGPLQLLVTNLDYDEHKGRIAVGRVQSGSLVRGATVSHLTPGAGRGDGCRAVVVHGPNSAQRMRAARRMREGRMGAVVGAPGRGGAGARNVWGHRPGLEGNVCVAETACAVWAKPAMSAHLAP